MNLVNTPNNYSQGIIYMGFHNFSDMSEDE